MSFFQRARGILRHWEAILFCCGLALLIFGYGFAVAKYKLPPYHLISEAISAGNSLRLVTQLRFGEAVGKNPHVIRVKESAATVPGAASGPGHGQSTFLDPKRAYNGVTFMTMYRDNHFGMFLVDMEGHILRSWTVPEKIAKKWKIGDYGFVFGAHLYRNGDVVFNINYEGMIKIDKESRVLWTLRKHTHHSVFVDREGYIWAPGRRLIRDPEKAYPGLEVPYSEDLILRISPEGKVTETISLLEALYKGTYQGLILSGDWSRPGTTLSDPSHLNDVEIIGEQFAKAHDFANQGDILVSCRIMDAVAIIDRKTKVVKWSLSGPFLRQHDPDPLPDGTLIVFDNRADRAYWNFIEYSDQPGRFGYSRVIRLDPSSQEILWCYQGSRKHPFYTSIHGKQQVLPNGDVLIVESEGGRVFEVDPHDNDIVWEFVNTIGKDMRGRVTGATRMRREDLDFLKE
ncbi:MAG: arylsulfotransferase family protein [Deltaproteobacteria bacterium]